MLSPDKSVLKTVGLRRRVNKSSATRFVGAERDSAQVIAREWYRQQNATGFSYQAGKKDFDTLVKEAEQSIIQKKSKDAQVYKASEDELARLAELQKLNQMQIDGLEKQRSELEKKYPGLAAASQPYRLRRQRLKFPPNVPAKRKSLKHGPVSPQSKPEAKP